MNSQVVNEIVCSIIIPAKNEERNLSECLTALQSLDFKQNQIEIIVVDNDSTDGTSQLAEQFGAHVIRIRRSTIGGLRNRGADKAKGEIYAFIDADCIPDKDWLKNAVETLKDPQIAAVGSKPSIPEMETTWVQKTWLRMKNIPRRCEVKWLSSSNFIVRETVFKEVNGFDDTLETCEDADIGYRISRNWKMVNDPSVKIYHLREPRTIVEFFQKEMWHGAANYRGMFRHGLAINEIPSLIFPIITGIGVFGILVGIILVSVEIFIGSVILMSLPPILQSLKVITRTGLSGFDLKVWILCFIYSIARFFAIFRLTNYSKK